MGKGLLFHPELKCPSSSGNLSDVPASKMWHGMHSQSWMWHDWPPVWALLPGGFQKRKGATSQFSKKKKQQSECEGAGQLGDPGCCAVKWRSLTDRGCRLDMSLQQVLCEHRYPTKIINSPFLPLWEIADFVCHRVNTTSASKIRSQRGEPFITFSFLF